MSEWIKREFDVAMSVRGISAMLKPKRVKFITGKKKRPM
ncbi:hypothetical protein IDH45_06055 [Paenibacillus sp. IB182363]|uniref:Uncharacterized protein n=1 Tax=Paenibacillus oceani TaxID=2772510 RepID=A0A927C562_9BACL|nr:hypothetical protein [Paenibacillus oceani]